MSGYRITSLKFCESVIFRSQLFNFNIEIDTNNFLGFEITFIQSIIVYFINIVKY